jgi:hypothetical protein
MNVLKDMVKSDGSKHRLCGINNIGMKIVFRL